MNCSVYERKTLNILYLFRCFLFLFWTDLFIQTFSIDVCHSFMGFVKSPEKKRGEAFASITLMQLLECFCYMVVSNIPVLHRVFYIAIATSPVLWSLFCELCSSLNWILHMWKQSFKEHKETVRVPFRHCAGSRIKQDSATSSFYCWSPGLQQKDLNERASFKRQYLYSISEIYFPFIILYTLNKI